MSTSGRARTNLARRVAPPEPLARRARVVIGVLAVVAVGSSFQGSIPSASITYAAREWGNSTADQTRALAVIRADIVITVVLMRLADRIGRRRMLQATAALAPLLTASCALAPNMAAFAALQVIARGFVTATGILIAVIAVEEVPAGSRAWASGALVIAAAVGSGIAVGSVSIADRGVQIWRWLYLIPLATVAVVPLIGRHVPESERFLRHARAAPEMVGTNDERLRDLVHEVRVGVRTHRRRLIPLCVFLGLLAFQNAPSRQLQNDYLRLERGYGSAAVAVFSIASNAPGVIGLMVGSLLGDRVGRKRLLTGAVIGFGVCDAGMFLSHGGFIWFWSITGALIGASSLPILGIITAELFPTSFRSTANGVTLAASRLGGALGLLAVGVATHWWSRGSSIAVTSAFVFVALGVLPLLPETGGHELEALNPEDAREASTRR